MKSYADKKRHAITRQMLPGNTVSVGQHRKDKLTSPFDHRPYTVVNRKGILITAKRNDRNITRNASHFKLIKREPGIVVIDSNKDVDVYSPTLTDTPAIPANARDVNAHAETAPSDAS